jgi:hypothetical protein
MRIRKKRSISLNQSREDTLYVVRRDPKLLCTCLVLVDDKFNVTFNIR